MPIKTAYSEIHAYTTKDGSIIHELMRPDQHGNRNLSLAEATIPEGKETLKHKHIQSEEIYHILKGSGMMTLGKERFEVKVGDSICILPGTSHMIKNIGSTPLKILCCCSPPYYHDDTELIL